MKDIQTMAWVLRQARIQKQITQTELGRRAKVARGRISDFEAGRRQPSDAELVAMAPHLDLLPARLRRLKLAPAEAKSDLVALFCPEKPRYRMPRERDTSARLLALRSCSRGRFDTLWTALRRREDWAHVRRFLMEVVTDSRHEIHGWMRLLQDSCLPAQLAPMRVGYRILPVVVPRTHENIGDCPIPALVDRQRCGLVLPQVTVLTPSELRMDGLVGRRVKGELRWCAAEFDGAGHDPASDKDRARLLRMPVVRFSAADLERPEFAHYFWSCVDRALWPA